MADAVLVLQHLELVDDGLHRALPDAHAVESAHATERALRATTPVRQHRRKPRAFGLEAVERADRPVIGGLAHRQQVERGNDVDVLGAGLAFALDAEPFGALHKNDLPEVVDIAIPVDGLDQPLDRDLGLIEERDVGRRDVVENPFDIVGDVHAADRNPEPGGLCPLAYFLQRPMRHGEHACHPDQVGIEFAQFLVEPGLPRLVKIKFALGTGQAALLQHLVVEVSDLHLDPDAPEFLRDYGQPVRRIVRIAEALGGVIPEVAGFRIGRGYEEDAADAACGEHPVEACFDLEGVFPLFAVPRLETLERLN